MSILGPPAQIRDYAPSTNQPKPPCWDNRQTRGSGNSGWGRQTNSWASLTVACTSRANRAENSSSTCNDSPSDSRFLPPAGAQFLLGQHPRSVRSSVQAASLHFATPGLELTRSSPCILRIQWPWCWKYFQLWFFIFPLLLLAYDCLIHPDPLRGFAWTRTRRPAPPSTLLLPPCRNSSTPRLTFALSTILQIPTSARSSLGPIAGRGKAFDHSPYLTARDRQTRPLGQSRLSARLWLWLWLCTRGAGCIESNPSPTLTKYPRVFTDAASF